MIVTTPFVTAQRRRKLELDLYPDLWAIDRAATIEVLAEDFISITVRGATHHGLTPDGVRAIVKAEAR